MGFIQIIRNILLAFCLLLSLVATGLLAHYAHYTIINEFGGVAIHPFQILGFVTGVLSVILIPVMMIGKHTVILDLIGMLIFWVLWLTEMVLLKQHRLKRFGRFRVNFACTTFSASYCYETFVIQNLLITLVALSLFHILTLFIYALVCHFNGSPIWSTSMRRLNKPVQAPPFIPGQMATPGVMQMPITYYNPAPMSYEPEKPVSSHVTGASNSHGEPVVIVPSEPKIV
ncbi:hypothetical protein CVT24_000716 [Panaeolus cyanescens]|uniref:MARVEL domain-containing protein n=1 Tax=Panaeolus cyanescens TaxID=181874 RepID=A0A409YT71_9AGAR|nr:hypothetical protein CVT24_000716 [Panaeolus cyanescens]